MVDTSPPYGSGEISVGDYATALGIADKMFIANNIWSTGEFLADESHANRSLEQSMQRLWRKRIDVMQAHSLVNVDVIVSILRGWKKEGRIRYLGVSHHELPYFPALAIWVEKDDLDFVQVHYSIHTRLAEERILPAALDKGTAVLVNMPFEKDRFFRIVEDEGCLILPVRSALKTGASSFSSGLFRILPLPAQFRQLRILSTRPRILARCAARCPTRRCAPEW